MFIAQHNSMTELCRALFKYENERKSVGIIDLQLVAYSNDMAFRKRGRLGLDHVKIDKLDTSDMY